MRLACFGRLSGPYRRVQDRPALTGLRAVGAHSGRQRGRHNGILSGPVSRGAVGADAGVRLRGRTAGLRRVCGSPPSTCGVDGRCRRRCADPPRRRHRSRDPGLAAAWVPRHPLPRAGDARRSRRLARGREPPEHTICRLSPHFACPGSHRSGAVARDGIRGCQTSVRPGCGLTKMGSRDMGRGGAGT